MIATSAEEEECRHLVVVGASIFHTLAIWIVVGEVAEQEVEGVIIVQQMSAWQ